jgi:uncharacterized protein YndB with AHSA1/START domain
MIRPIRAIALEARLDATPAQVWHALTDAAALADWFAPDINADQREGGIVELSWSPEMTWPTTIEIWDPERHLRWADPAPAASDGTPQPRLIVDWFISTDAGQTVLRFVHSGFGEGANWDDQIDGLVGGWKYFLWNLEMCLTRHRGTHRVMVSARRHSGVSRAALWDSLFTAGLLALAAGSPDAKDFTLTLGERSLAGVVETSESPFRFAARLPSLSDALLFIELEGTAPTNFDVGFWLSTYGVDEKTVAALQQSLADAVEKLVEPSVPATL